MRKFFLFLSTNKKVEKLAKKHGLKLGAKKFVAGASIDSVVKAATKINEQGFLATIDCLGEFVSSEQEAIAATGNCIDTLEAIHASKIDASLSLKLTQLGLDISEDLCFNNMTKILEVAKSYNIFVQIDMEDHSRNEATLSMFKRLHDIYKGTVGTVIQSYLHKSLEDVNELDHYNASLRICKGAYKESSEVAFPNKKDVDENYMNLVKTHLLNGNYVGIATHDSTIIDQLISFIREEKIQKEQYEFQMLYGIAIDLQKKLIQEGYKLRVYIPYGDDWFGYFMRRLAERPANVWFIVKNLF
ncbi:proline dehydrogenase family protein (plasmid) [Rossellomorea sp. AcN35-11]|nr:proline dehydrogenase family protein [Rossellomorea aquimaris]WJV31982.1 proline dehydrogenase family protein [Rossellomorea sp. AcN35-11]